MYLHRLIGRYETYGFVPSLAAAGAPLSPGGKVCLEETSSVVGPAVCVDSLRSAWRLTTVTFTVRGACVACQVRVLKAAKKAENNTEGEALPDLDDNGIPDDALEDDPKWQISNRKVPTQPTSSFVRYCYKNWQSFFFLMFDI